MSKKKQNKKNIIIVGHGNNEYLKWLDKLGDFNIKNVLNLDDYTELVKNKETTDKKSIAEHFNNFFFYKYRAKLSIRNSKQ